MHRPLGDCAGHESLAAHRSPEPAEPHPNPGGGDCLRKCAPHAKGPEQTGCAILFPSCHVSVDSTRHYLFLSINPVQKFPVPAAQATSGVAPSGWAI